MGNETEIKTRRFVIGENTPVAVGLVIVLVGFAFWMGVLHTTVNGMSGNLEKVLLDHETRLRVLERSK